MCHINPPRSGRYVGILTTRRQFLQLCEVEIFSKGASVLSKAVVELVYTTLSFFSINTQVIIQNRALSLARYLGLSADNHLDGQL